MVRPHFRGFVSHLQRALHSVTARHGAGSAPRGRENATICHGLRGPLGADGPPAARTAAWFGFGFRRGGRAESHGGPPSPAPVPRVWDIGALGGLRKRPIGAGLRGLIGGQGTR